VSVRVVVFARRKVRCCCCLLMLLVYLSLLLLLFAVAVVVGSLLAPSFSFETTVPGDSTQEQVSVVIVATTVLRL